MLTEPRPPLAMRLPPRQLVALDCLASSGYACFAYAVFSRHDTVGGALAGAVLIFVPLLFHRRHVLPAFAGLLAGFWLSPLIYSFAFLALPPFTFLIYRVAATVRSRTAVIALTVSLTGPLATALPDFEHKGAVIPFSLVLVTAWTIGRAVGQRRRYGDAMLEHREQLAVAAVENARQQVVEERLRIARELHDVVAHSMSVVTVQAAFGHLVFTQNPEAARAALGAVETTGRQTLVEMRRLLGVLRDEQEANVERGVDRSEDVLAPAPTLADLQQLVTQIGTAGVRIDVTVTGSRRKLGAGLELSAFRIVQEALTNVVRHAGTTSARVELDYGDDELGIVVSDDGLGCDAAALHGNGSGHGLVGIRERVGLYGGRLQLRPGPAGGLELSVTLPLVAPVAEACRTAAPAAAAGSVA